jgi:hypothetical protein
VRETPLLENAALVKLGWEGVVSFSEHIQYQHERNLFFVACIDMFNNCKIMLNISALT